MFSDFFGLDWSSSILVDQIVKINTNHRCISVFFLFNICKFQSTFWYKVFSCSRDIEQMIILLQILQKEQLCQFAKRGVCNLHEYMYAHRWAPIDITQFKLCFVNYYSRFKLIALQHQWETFLNSIWAFSCLLCLVFIFFSLIYFHYAVDPLGRYTVMGIAPTQNYIK